MKRCPVKPNKLGNGSQNKFKITRRNAPKRSIKFSALEYCIPGVPLTIIYDTPYTYYKVNKKIVINKKD
jgi:hypothetical protein